MSLAVLILAWLIVSFPIALLIGNFVFAGYGEDESTLSGDRND